MLRQLLAISFVILMTLPSWSADAVAEKDEKHKTEGGKAKSALAFEMKTLAGKPIKLDAYEGKVVMVVNVASRCGLTPQYKQLQALHEKYGEKGLSILGFPCNQFGRQEPGTSDQIQEFCTENYGVEFDMFSKVEVNGDKACDLYKYLTKLDTRPKGAGKIAWNFEKFLLDRKGNVIGRFEPRMKPDDPKVIAMIEKSLAQKPAKKQKEED